MDAKVSGVTYGVEDLLRILQKGNKALALVGEKDRMGFLPELEKALESFKDRVSFEVSILKPTSFSQFLALANPTQAMFNQLASEIPWWVLLDQIEESCFLQSSAIERARPFIAELWKDEVAENPFKPPAGWKYLPVEEAVGAYRKLFGSGLKATSVFKLAKEAKPHEISEGIPTWLKLTFLFYYFEIPKLLGISEKVRPWDDTSEGLAAYAKIVEIFVPEVGKSYIKAFPKFSFKNWREGQLTAGHIQLAPASRKIWQKMESESDDDFVIARNGANTGSLYGGYSVRRSRLAIVLTGKQFPQDCVMAGSTPIIQPDRLTKHEHLGIDCPGTKYSPGADGKFSYSLCFYWFDGDFRFGDGWAGGAFRSVGSAAGFLG